MMGACIYEDQVAWNAAMHFWTNGEWPTPSQVWQRLTSHPLVATWSITLEDARQACIAACDSGEVYGIPTVTAMRLGEASGDWLAPFGDRDPWRIAVPQEMMQELGASRHFQSAVVRARAA